MQGRNQRVAAEAVDLRRQLHQRDETCSRLQAQTSSLQAQVCCPYAVLGHCCTSPIRWSPQPWAVCCEGGVGSASTWIHT